MIVSGPPIFAADPGRSFSFGPFQDISRASLGRRPETVSSAGAMPRSAWQSRSVRRKWRHDRCGAAPAVRKPATAREPRSLNGYPFVIRITYLAGESSDFCFPCSGFRAGCNLLRRLRCSRSDRRIRHCNERGHAGELLEQHCKDPVAKDGAARQSPFDSDCQTHPHQPAFRSLRRRRPPVRYICAHPAAYASIAGGWNCDWAKWAHQR